MPKGKRKGKSDRYEKKFPASDDESINDNASIFSSQSENKSLEDEEQDCMLQDQFEEKLIDAIDGISQKSAQGRTNCLISITKALVSKYIPLFIAERHFTICDGIEKALKKGGMAEKTAAADLASILCVQLGAETDGEAVCKSLKPVLITTASDNSVSAVVRGKCCSTLALMSFITNAEMDDVLSIMRQFEIFFSASFLKGDGTVPNLAPDVANFHAAALNGWGLLLTTMDPDVVLSMITKTKSLVSISQLAELLESQHLEVRLTAGDVLALIYEIGQNDEDLVDEFAGIIETLKVLATESHKYRAKKDRKQQRATFRDILLYMEEDTLPDIQVKFGKEMLVLDSWTKRKQYETMCSLLGPAINIHLAENDYLREMFEVVPPVILAENNHAQNQMERFRRRLMNAANFKARTLSRGKNRDKRSDF